MTGRLPTTWIAALVALILSTPTISNDKKAAALIQP